MTKPKPLVSGNLAVSSNDYVAQPLTTPQNADLFNSEMVENDDALSDGSFMQKGNGGS